MNRKEIKQILIGYINEKLEANNIIETTDLETYDEFSSIFVVELILFIEENFDLEVYYEDYDMINYTNVSSIIDVVIRNKKNNDRMIEC